jgi:predicted ABC-type ATPase
MNYEITLLYFWLDSPEMAIQRVAERVSKGGHHIPSEAIERRFYRGIKNFFNLYMNDCDNWMVINNMDMKPSFIAKGKKDLEKTIINSEIWETILIQSRDEQHN